LAVRPDRQGAGVGKAIVRAAVDWLVEQGVATLGLETMPRTVENIGFYARLGFAPGHLTVTLTNDIATRGHAAPALLSQRTRGRGRARGHPARRRALSDALRRHVPPARRPRLSRPLDRPPHDLRRVRRAAPTARGAVLELGDLGTMRNAECGMRN